MPDSSAYFTRQPTNETKERKQQEMNMGLLAMADETDAMKRELVNQLNTT